MTVTELIDSLPPTAENYLLDYNGFWDCDSRCRIRIYRQDASLRVPVVIVASELPDNDGTSVTNLAELVFYIAWTRAGRPRPVMFVEHYPADGLIEGEGEESFAFVEFPIEGHWSDCIFHVRNSEGRSSFDQPGWRHASSEDIEVAIGQALLVSSAEPVRMTPEQESDYLKDIDRHMEAVHSGEEEMEAAAAVLTASQEIAALKPHADEEQENYELETAMADRAIDAEWIRDGAEQLNAASEFARAHGETEIARRWYLAAMKLNQVDL